MGLELVSSLQHRARNMLEMFVIQRTSIWPNFVLIVLRIKKNKHNFHYVAMTMTTSQILKFVDFTKIQKSKYFENEQIIFSSNKKIHEYIKDYFMAKIKFEAKITFNNFFYGFATTFAEIWIKPPSDCFCFYKNASLFNKQLRYN